MKVTADGIDASKIVLLCMNSEWLDGVEVEATELKSLLENFVEILTFRLTGKVRGNK